MCIHVCTCVENKGNVRCRLEKWSPPPLRQGLSFAWSSPARMDWSASEPGIHQAPLPQHWDRVLTTTPSICMSILLLTLGSQAPYGLNHSPNPVTVLLWISAFKLIALPNINTGKGSPQLQWLWTFPTPLKMAWPFPRTRKWPRHIYSKTTWARDRPQCWM